VIAGAQSLVHVHASMLQAQPSYLWRIVGTNGVLSRITSRLMEILAYQDLGCTA
jgi:hypothetical protein